MSPESFKRKLTAILSADVKEYSRLMGENEAETVKTLTSYRSSPPLSGANVLLPDSREPGVKPEGRKLI